MLMIRFYYHPTPNPAKVALMLEELGLPYQVIPVDTGKGEQHKPEFRAINPNGKVPAIVDTDGPDGKEARVFDSTAILLYLGHKTGRLIGSAADLPELLSWLLFIATGIGPLYGALLVKRKFRQTLICPFAQSLRWGALYSMPRMRLAAKVVCDRQSEAEPAKS